METPINDAGKRIFIVEDEALVAEALRIRIEKLGYVVSGMASRGEDAVAMMMVEPPDLVLMDIRLAGKLDGITAGRQIQDCLGLPVVYLTANTDRATLDQILSVRAAGYVPKPIHDAALQSALGIALQQQAYKQAYQRRERHYLSTLAKLEDVVVVLDTNRRLIYLNLAARELIGGEVSYPTRDDEVVVFIGERGEILDPVAECLEQGQETSLEAVWCHSYAGKRVRVRVDAIPITNPLQPREPGAGEVIDIVLIMHRLHTGPSAASLPEYIRVCAYCRDIMERNAENLTVTMRFETYFQQRCNYQFTHGICPNCRDALLGKWKAKYPG